MFVIQNHFFPFGMPWNEHVVIIFIVIILRNQLLGKHCAHTKIFWHFPICTRRISLSPAVMNIWNFDLFAAKLVVSMHDDIWQIRTSLYKYIENVRFISLLACIKYSVYYIVSMLAYYLATHIGWHGIYVSRKCTTTCDAVGLLPFMSSRESTFIVTWPSALNIIFKCHKSVFY